MKKTVATILVALTCTSDFAQAEIDGTIVFRNRNIPTSNPEPTSPGFVPGANGNGSYNVPIWAPFGRATQRGAGDLPGGVTVGLFNVRSDTPLAIAVLFSSGAGTAFFELPRLPPRSLREQPRA